MKQTAVEWLYDTIDNELIDFLESRIDVNELSVAMLKAKEQAKEMEKQQIMDAVNEGIKQGYTDYIDTEWGRDNDYNPEQYYNETYGGNKQECQFEPDSNLTSATKCKWCGQEKWQHKTYGNNK